MPAEPPVATRRTRKDAVGNRARILEVAATAFAERGLAVDVREIARLAGVGVGTFYRHFPTKQLLLDAVVGSDVDSWTAVADRAAESDDAWAGIGAVLEHTLELMAGQRALLDGLVDPVENAASFEACRVHLGGVLAGLVGRAHRQGTLRADVDADDIALQLLGLSGILRLTAERAPDAWRHHLGIVLDGLRPR